jgi:hypothetical protein
MSSTADSWGNTSGRCSLENGYEAFAWNPLHRENNSKINDLARLHGLQIRVERFDSASRLHKTSMKSTT